MLSIQNRQGLLPFWWIDPDKVVLLASLQKGHSLAHQCVEQDDAGLRLVVLARGIGRAFTSRDVPVEAVTDLLRGEGCLA